MRGTLRLEWTWLIGLLLLCLLFVPARRYSLPITLPFELDLYRALLAGTLGLWFLSLLSDERVRVRASGLEGPLILYLVAVSGSLLANADRVSAYQGEAVKSLFVLASVVLTFYLVVSALRSLEDVEAILAILVLGSAVVAAFAVIESRTGWTPFDSLDRYVPILRPIAGDEGALLRDGRFRAAGSAEHPVALSAMFALVAPIAVAFAVRRRGSVIWWAALGLLVIGAVSTVSRTAVVMLVTSFAVFCALQWREARRFIPLALVVLACVHLLVPGALGSLRQGLSPSRAIAEQQSLPDSELSAGRIADLGPSFEEFSRKPVLGYGAGTRIVVGEKANARLLDNQWLGTLLDTGIVGVFALAWLFARFVSRLTRASAAAAPADAVLLVALACSALAYAVGMFFFDSFAFIQVTLVLFVVLGAGCALALAPGRIFEALPEPIVAPAFVRKRRLRARIAAAAAIHRERVRAQLERARDYGVRRRPPEA
ncbi:MAG: O-antigen polymerase [Gaiellaceae bacterium]|jgi:O-antigen ligase|nr:MAG: O-antigen polymerase [Gaiellaceae bacterium]